MIRHTAAFLVLSIAVIPTLAQTSSNGDVGHPGMHLTSDDAEAMVVAGRTAMMAFRLEDAEATFQRLLAQPGNNEAALYHLTAIDFVKAMFGQDEQSFDDFYERCDMLGDLLEDKPESAWRLFFAAENYLMNGFARGREGDFLRAAVSARQAYETYLDALRRDPTLIDAETGVGLLKALIGATPPAYRRFLKLFGYKGTIDEGLMLLDHAAKKSRYNRPQAALFRDLTRVFMNKGRPAATERLGASFEDSRNPASGLLYAFALRFTRDPEKAVLIATEALEIAGQPEFAKPTFLHYHLGAALFSLNRFEEAIPELQEYLRLFEGQSYLASAKLRLGVSLEMLGRRAEAEEIYEDVRAPTEFDIDLAAQRDAKKLLREPLTANGKNLIIGRNAVSGRRHDEALAVLQSVFFAPEATEVERAQAAYYLGRSHHLAGNLGEAATKYVYVQTHPTDNDERWAPWALYYLGKLRLAEGRVNDAKELFEQALDQGGDYDYKKSLRRNSRLALDGL